MMDLSGADLWFELHADVAALEVSDGVLHLRVGDGLSGSVPCRQPKVAEALAQLRHGPLALGQWGQLAQATSDGGAEAEAVLGYLTGGRLLSWWFGRPSSVLITFEPLSGAFDPVRSAPIGNGFTLSPLALMAHCEQGVQINEPLATAKVTVRWEALELLPQIVARGWHPEQGSQGSLPDALSRALVAGGLFRPPQAESRFGDAWTPEAWWMHRSLRDNTLAALTFGGDERGKVAPLPPLEAPPERLIGLPPRADGALGASFYEVMVCRKSHREPGADPLTIAQLGSLLWTSARFRSKDPEGAIRMRPKLVPMAGMLGELELYLAVNRCAGLERGFYRYDAVEHGLEPIAEPSKPFEAMLKDAAWRLYIGEQRPDVLIVFSTRLARLAWKYGPGSYRLTLMNLGVMYEALYLAATELGLSPCGVGFGDLWQFARLTGRDPFEETSIGEFALSGAPAEQASGTE